MQISLSSEEHSSVTLSHTHGEYKEALVTQTAVNWAQERNL